jgi:AraC family transcriptional activator of tynA and feaB
MKIVLSTAEIHPRDRFLYWHEVACRHLVDHDSSPECRASFRAELQAGALSDIGLVLFANASMTISHARQHAARANPEELFVCRQLGGRLVLDQEAREVVLEPGDMTLLDPRLPYSGRFSEDSRLLVLKVPRYALEARIGKTRTMVSRLIKPSNAENGLTAAFLALLPSHADGLSRASEQIVREQALDLIAVSLANATAGTRARISSARSVTLVNVRAVIEARLTDPALDSATVAAAAGVSVRYANAILANEDTSIMRLVQARRLERCRRALEDPLQAHRRVSEIAYSWGFSDMTHFGRRFKAVYGQLPRECRKRAIST